MLVLRRLTATIGTTPIADPGAPRAGYWGVGPEDKGCPAAGLSDSPVGHAQAARGLLGQSVADLAHHAIDVDFSQIAVESSGQ